VAFCACGERVARDSNRAAAVNTADLPTVGLLVLLEGLLSADNALVLGVLVLGLPCPLQKKALRYGLFGALAFRIIATVLAIQLVALVSVQLAGGLHLLNLTYQHFRDRSRDGMQQTVPPAVPWLRLSAFWATVVKVEFTDIVFAMDSILVAVAVTPEAWVVITGGMLGVVAMRLVTGQLVSVLRRYRRLIDAAFIVVGCVGVKLFIELGNGLGWLALRIPPWASLAVLFLILAGAAVQARVGPPRS
jgi:YkoY family integral membrane protein